MKAVIQHKFYDNSHQLNYKRLVIGSNRPVIYPDMVHGTNVASIDSSVSIAPAILPVDGLVTREPGIMLAIGTADCAPIVFIDEENEVIGLAHAGWKGAVDGIIKSTLDVMLRLGASVSSITAHIGPCMSQCSYEAGEDMREHCLSRNASFDKFFNPDPLKKGKFKFNLSGLCMEQVFDLGVKAVVLSQEDTYTDPNYHSHRQYTHLGDVEAARPQSENNGRYRNLTTVEILSV